MTVVGIDLGTTNTVVGVVKEGHAAALADEQGSRLIPSVVSFHPSGNVLVGKGAKDRRLVDAANTVYSIKRLIGRSWDSEEVKKARERFPFEMREGPGQAALVVARGQTYTLPEISAFVLRRAKAVAEAALGAPVEKAVITVPANFNDLQRAATKVAGRVAGLEVMRILNEPTAAALAYGYGKTTNERIAVYDFGGGTFDVTLLDLSENVFEVLATAGNTFLGGDDIDLAIAERMANMFLQQHKTDPRADGQAYERLRAAAEEVKVRLSRESEVTLRLPEVAHGPGGKPLDLEFRMTRGEFEALVGPIVERTFDVCREAMNIARLGAGDFDQVLLVCGSTRIPLVRQHVEAFFKRPVLGHISPDEVVAIGAAIQAAALTGGTERRRELPAAPAPASRGPIARKGQTWPPGMQRPPVSAEPGTEPYGGRTRSPTSPGVQADSGARQLPIGAAQRVVVPGDPRQRVETGQGVAPPPGSAAPGTAPPGTVAGLGARGRVPTGSGLGPDAEKARRMTDPGGFGEGPSQIMVPDRAPIQLPGLEDPTAEAGHIASFLARYASTPQKPRTTQPQGAAPKPKEESIAHRLSDDEIQYDDPSAVQSPNTADLRRMAGPMSTDEVTEVHKRRSRVSIDEQALPLPSIPDDEDMTMDTATSPQAQAPLGLGGTMQMHAQPPPPPMRGVPGSLATPTSPNPALAAGLPGPFGQASTLVSPPHGAPPIPTAPMHEVPSPFPAPGAAPGMPPPFSPGAPFGGPLGAPPLGAPPPFAAQPPMPPAAQNPRQTASPAWAPPLGVAAAMPGLAGPAIQQMAPGPATPLLVDVTPLTLTVETVQGFCDPVIGRNSPVPCERSRTFVTAADNQTTVRVRVAQGESKLFRENTLLGEVELSGLRPAPRGQVKIDVLFGLDTDGILNVRAVDVATGHEARVTVRLVAVPDMGNVAEMAARHAAMPMMS